MPVDDSTLAPKYAIEIEGTPVEANVAPFMRHVEYESTDGMADMAKLVLENPNNIISNAKMFQPGNEMSIFMGYGKTVSLTHIGRVVIIKNIPNYPQGAVPTIQIIGYSKDTEMMENSPQESAKRTFAQDTYSEIVQAVAEYNGFDTDIDETPAGMLPEGAIHKPGTSDYEFVQGIANIVGYIFWIDGDANGKWTLHFKAHQNLQQTVQEKKYTFRYNDGDLSSLLTFIPELTFKENKVKIGVALRSITGVFVQTEIEEDITDTPDSSAIGNPSGEIINPYQAASAITLYFGKYTFDMITARKFTSEAQAIEWVRQWFRRQRENFILSRGKTIGMETLMARQIHAIEGISLAYEGDYYFTKVKHVMNASVGYACNFNARKVIQ